MLEGAKMVVKESLLEYTTKNKRLFQDLFFDHICRSYNETFGMDVASIVEILFCCTKMVLNNFEKEFITGDNASAYSNNLVTLVFPFIAQQFGINLKLYLHSKVKAWKRPADSP